MKKWRFAQGWLDVGTRLIAEGRVGRMGIKTLGQCIYLIPRLNQSVSVDNTRNPIMQ